MLLGKFFNISDRKITGSDAAITIDINPSHPIFEGHFPGQPVVPGVCMMQILKEILETMTSRKWQLRKADQLKFLAVINPLETPSVIVEFTRKENGETETTLTGRFYRNEITYLKFKTTFIIPG